MKITSKSLNKFRAVYKGYNGDGRNKWVLYTNKYLNPDDLEPMSINVYDTDYNNLILLDDHRVLKTEDELAEELLEKTGVVLGEHSPFNEEVISKFQGFYDECRERKSKELDNFYIKYRDRYDFWKLPKELGTEMRSLLDYNHKEYAKWRTFLFYKREIPLKGNGIGPDFNSFKVLSQFINTESN